MFMQPERMLRKRPKNRVDDILNCPDQMEKAAAFNAAAFLERSARSFRILHAKGGGNDDRFS